MPKRIIAIASLCFGAVLAWQAAYAQDVLQTHHRQGVPACPPGHKVVEETCYKDVCRYECKQVPDVRKVKKWVYSCVDDPFCIHHSGKKSHGHHDCGTDCPSCKGPFPRKLLVKREVVVDEICETKCVVEKVVEKVAYKVYHTIPSTSPCPPGTSVVTPEVLKALPEPVLPKKL